MLNGMHYLFEGFKLIAKPGLKRYVIIPFIINVGFFLGLFFLMRYFIREFNAWFVSFLPVWLQWLSVIIWLLFFIGFFLILIYLFVTLANLISAPFNSFLAEKVEFYLKGKVADPRSLFDNIKDIPRIIGRQFSILGYYLPRFILILIVFFIPIIHVIAPILSFLLSAWFMTLTYIDYPTDNHQISLKDVKVWLNKHNWDALGFGISVLICTMIPIFNFLVMPAAVAGATKFWLENE